MLEGWSARKGPQPVPLRPAGYTAAAPLKCYGAEPGIPDVVGANREIPMKYLKGIKVFSSKKVTQPTSQLRCLCTNAHSMGNQQEGLEAAVLLESYELLAITETWWDKSCDWSATIDGYSLFRRDSQGRRSRGIAFCIKKWIDCEELSLKNSHEQLANLRVRIVDEGNKGNLVVDVYYRPPDQGEPIEEVVFLQPQEVLHLQALILLGDFNHPAICWKSSMASCRQSRRLPEYIEDKFLSQVIDSPTRGDVMLDVLESNTKELIGDNKIGGSLGCSDHGLLECAVLRDVGQAKSKVMTLNLRKAKFQLFKELVSRTPWERAFRHREAEQSQQIFKDAFQRAQDLSSPMCKKEGKTSMAKSRPAGPTNGQEGTAQAVEAGTGILERGYGYWLVVQGRCQED